MDGLGEAIERKAFEKGKKLGKEMGIKLGIKQGEMKILISLMKDGLISLKDAARRANMSETEFSQLMNREKK